MAIHLEGSWQVLGREKSRRHFKAVRSEELGIRRLLRLVKTLRFFKKPD
jgi:hypothetical protein